MENSEFLPITEAARKAQVSRITMRRALANSGIETFRDPLDRRLRLIRVQDLNALRTPRPINAQDGDRLPAA